MPEREGGEQIQAALAEVWDRMRPVVFERVAAVEQAAAALVGDAPDAEIVEAGRGAAHKLAGVLGTFGLDRGTELARELEAGFGAADTPNAGAQDTAELARLAAELRTVVQGARAGAPEGP